MSAEARRDWLMTHPTLGVALLVSTIMVLAMPIVLVPAAASGVASAVPIALGSTAFGWVGAFIYARIAIQRQGAGPDWRPPTPNSSENDGEGE
ncbi:unannotated protein [freshwater metagenome]|uniref:Unannotated protein n=1 Tax=freshwater metagenome TaxID=449393 RepID=A0A6J7D4Z8_9ZZZZ|nr:hypothetical protein [Actinomycetota bacterium]MSX32445.1 hypothetical protein [Actinomycetota bacterium]MSZ29638.1 hypothetical protein [Actinomycetota bacterium]